jgi:ABC-type dipeptide/oligopeptide/nickel transport system permease component
VGFVMSECFVNMCTCIYYILHCLYCVFVLFRVCLFVFVLSILPPSDNSVKVNNNNNNNNNNIENVRLKRSVLRNYKTYLFNIQS